MYYIWEVNQKLRLVFAEPVGRSHTVKDAKTSARISATHSKHHRMVTRGKAVDAEVIRIYQAGTGERIYPPGA